MHSFEEEVAERIAMLKEEQEEDGWADSDAVLRARAISDIVALGESCGGRFDNGLRPTYTGKALQREIEHQAQHLRDKEHWLRIFKSAKKESIH